MNCSSLRRALPAFVGEELSPARTAEVRAHLKDCHPCARAFASEREMRLRLRAAARAPEPPADLWGRVERAILERGRRPAPFLGLGLPRAAAAAGLLLAVTLGGALLLSDRGPAFPGAPGSAEPPGFARGAGAEEDYVGFLRPVTDGREFFTLPLGEAVPVSGPPIGAPFAPATGPVPPEGRAAGLPNPRRDF